MPKCTICKTKFKPIFSTLEKTCQDIDCKVKYSMQVVAKQKAKVLNDAKKEWNVKKRILKFTLDNFLASPNTTKHYRLLIR